MASQHVSKLQRDNGFSKRLAKTIPADYSRRYDNLRNKLAKNTGANTIGSSSLANVEPQNSYKTVRILTATKVVMKCCGAPKEILLALAAELFCHATSERKH